MSRPDLAGWVRDGTRVVAETAQGQRQAVGRVIACTDGPAVVILSDAGDAVTTWLAALCRTVAPLPADLAGEHAVAAGSTAVAEEVDVAAAPAGGGEPLGVALARGMRHPRQVLCRRGEHPWFLVDSADPVACPWCAPLAARVPHPAVPDLEAAAWGISTDPDRAVLVERFAEVIPDYHDDGDGDGGRRALAERLADAAVELVGSRPR